MPARWCQRGGRARVCDWGEIARGAKRGLFIVHPPKGLVCRLEALGWAGAAARAATTVGESRGAGRRRREFAAARPEEDAAVRARNRWDVSLYAKGAEAVCAALPPATRTARRECREERQCARRGRRRMTT